MTPPIPALKYIELHDADVQDVALSGSGSASLRFSWACAHRGPDAEPHAVWGVRFAIHCGRVSLLSVEGELRADDTVSQGKLVLDGVERSTIDPGSLRAATFEIELVMAGSGTGISIKGADFEVQDIEFISYLEEWTPR